MNACAPFQLLPLSPADVYLRETYYDYGSASETQWLAFTASLPPGGYTTVFITPVASALEAPNTFASVVTRVVVGGLGGDSTVAINNSRISLTFDSTTGLLSSYADATTGASSPLLQELRYYSASPGDWNSNLPAAGELNFYRTTSDLCATIRSRCC